MVTPAPRPPFRAPEVEKSASPGDGWSFWVGLGAVILLIYAISRCAGGTTAGNSADADASAANAEMSNAIAAQTPPPAEPLNAASVTRGISHLRMATTAEGLSGAMIYSQNCYDALSRQFGWGRLDQCGGFDMLAARSIESADTAGLDNEANYFQSEAAAGRYLAAATGAGQPAGEADTRLGQLQARVARVRAVLQPPPPLDDDSTNETYFAPEPPFVDADGNPLDEGTATTPGSSAGNRLASARLDRALDRPRSRVVGR